MANIKSQKKRIKTNEKSHEINKSFKSKVRTAYTKTLLAINNNGEDVKVLISNYFSLVDKGVTKGIFHINKAANKKAKIMRKYNKTLQEEKK